ncbi:MAG: FapA family protein [Desulfobulbaceae bacterium]|nr:FapA family protein [Desulfobulbaceae bacterium]
MKDGKKKKARSIAELDISFMEELYGASSEARGDDDNISLRYASVAAEVKKAEEVKIRVRVEPDGLQAFLVFVAVRGDALDFSSEKLAALLKEHGIVHGLLTAAIDGVAEQLHTSEEWRGEVEIARGTPAESATGVEYPFLTPIFGAKRELSGWKIGETGLSFLELQDILVSPDMEEVNRLRPKARLVRPGEVLACFNGPLQPKPGLDVYGRLIPVGSSTLLPEAGDGVELLEGGRQLVAKALGYLSINNFVFSVLSPLWVAPDRLTAYYVNLPGVADSPVLKLEDLASALEEKGICFGIDLTEATKNCLKLNVAHSADLMIPVAQGNAPRPGLDAKLKFAFDTEKKAGEIRENDTIDLRDRNLVSNVKKDDLIAVKSLPTKGDDGQSIYGEVIKASVGKDMVVTVGDGVQVQKKSDRILYHAKKDGSVLQNGGNIAVVELFYIDGNVDYSTGNISVQKDLHVDGSVLSGFQVMAAGNAIINGSVEIGAQVHVNGNLTVANGIIGEGTRVIVQGDLRTMFIQDAELFVGGDLWVGSYAFNGSIRVGGSAFVQRGLGTSGGKVVGGIICASKEIEVSTVGSPTNSHTILAIQPDPLRSIQLNKIWTTLRFCEENIAKIIRTLGLEDVTPQAIKKLLGQASGVQREHCLKILQTLSTLIKQQKSLEQDDEKVKNEIDENLSRATIRVTSEFFHGNQVQMSNRRLVLNQDYGSVTFRLEKGEIVFS